MSFDIDKIEQIARMKQEIEAAVAVINKASLKLNGMGLEVKLTGWDWEKAGWETRIATQGGLHSTIVELSTRPKS